MHRKSYPTPAVMVFVALAVVLSGSLAASAASITIDRDVATGPISNGSNIIVDGWVKGAQTMPPANAPPGQSPVVNVNKVKIYLFYQQTRPDPVTGSLGSARVQLDSNMANFGLGSSPDASYDGTVKANMTPSNTTIIAPRCWFMRCDAILDTLQAPNWPVDFIERDVNLVYTSPNPGGGGGS